ncbi:uncharacterized protein TOT_010000787 [Theileria orientalis strain Shintoku]|uniref:RING-type domain-containing protein n=1 Tax=Theileria orientalis strain Shintoku TaxID=869250 RepID=J4DNP7_THEOR|nr:uncharacterized protein TOT_010000787 [Theileria orientalis strain Shintoku]BAM39329.1 uncharacterized protein TOT_010000787 [Theileria orientalis strain Shintoku]|eukprot:XP_009689630.1 uncharacterized protein TOT_010000787 [Theileria orientalis strain Shintoku]
MDKSRNSNFDKSRRYRNGRGNHSRGKEKPTNAPKQPKNNRNFSAELRQIILDVFYNSKLPREFEVSKEQAVELLDFKPSYHFNCYLNCCICYENTLICAIGTCDHMTCLLCSLKLTYFYNNEGNKGIYECPYCKQPNEHIYFCVNPFYVHLALNKSFYSSKETPALTKGELVEFIKILTHSNESTKETEEILASATINIMQLYKIFLKNSSKVANMFTINGLITSVSNLSVCENRSGAQTIFEKTAESVSFFDEFLIVSNTNLIFESASIYYLYKLITSPLCWFAECKERWYVSNVTKENLSEAMKTVAKFKFSSYKFLNRHIKSSHAMVFCDICLSYFTNKKFLCEFVLYELTKIGEHVKNGDQDCHPPISAHVLCPACKTYHWDMATFKQHGKDEHFICELCDCNDDSYNVFSDYASLFSHFKTYHYPCEEPECMFVVFADELQLQLHYLYKHPGVTNTKCSKKPVQVTTKSAREQKSTKSTSMYSAFEDQSGYDAFWDGSINIVDPAERKEEVSEIVENPLETLKDSSLGGYFFPLEPSIMSAEENKEKLEKFLNGLRGSKDLPVASDYINNFDVTRATHVFSDLEAMMEYFKRHDVRVFDVSEYLNEVLAKLYVCLITSFTTQYNQVVSSCTTEECDGSALFNLVKGYLTKFLFLFYNLHINKPRFDAERFCIKLDLLKLREQNPEVKLGPNTLLFFICALNFANISNRIIVKAALNDLIGDMKLLYKDVKEPLSLSEAFNLTSKKNANSALTINGDNVSSTALNPNTNIVEHIPKKNRNQNIVKIPRKDYIVSLKGKKVVKAKPATPVLKPQEPTARVEEAAPVEADNPTPVNIPYGHVQLEDVGVDSETLFMNHVTTGNFYGLMYDIIGTILVANLKRFKAKSFEYSLRETTKLKILNIALSQKRSFTNLGEFVSMKKLESLQSLEPEFHRLVKEYRNSDLQTVATVWTRKCINVLRNTQVEHLEILHFYLKGNTETSIELCNDTEFPSLSNNANAAELSTPRNYAGAVGLRDTPKYLSEREFPTLTQTAKFKKKPNYSR